MIKAFKTSILSSRKVSSDLRLFSDFESLDSDSESEIEDEKVENLNSEKYLQTRADELFTLFN